MHGATSVLHALAGQISDARTEAAQAQVSADWDGADTESLLAHPVSVLRGRRLRPPDPDITLNPGDQVSLLVPDADPASQASA